MISDMNEISNFRHVITIDGPAGTGKSVTARQVARQLDLIYLDSGALYRTLVLALKQSGITEPSDSRIADCLERSIVSAKPAGNDFPVFIDNVDVSDQIRGEELSQVASRFATNGKVRNRVGELCRQIAADHGCVAEGRDLGSAVFPDADLKIYLTAALDERAKRRHRQLEASGTAFDLEQVRAEMKERDSRDRHREIAPLCFPQGGIRLDTTHLTFDEQVTSIVELYEGRGRLKGSRFFQGVQQFSRFMFQVVFGARIHHVENMPCGGVIVASNHISNIDPPLLGCQVPGAIAFMAKEELFRGAFLRWLISSLYAIPIRRGRIDRTALRACLTELNRAMPLIMFPQGTRVKEGATGKVHSGVAWLSRKAQVPVVPTRIRSNGLWKSILRISPIEVILGEAIPPPPKKSGKEDLEHSIRIMSAIESLTAR
jgi:cytidylate kinase